MSVHTITTPEQEQVLRQAATLSRMLQQTWKLIQRGVLKT